MCYAFLLQATLLWHNNICTITFSKYFLSHYHKYHHNFHHIWSMLNNKVMDDFQLSSLKIKWNSLLGFQMSYIDILLFSFFIWWVCVFIVEVIVRRSLVHHSTHGHFGCSSHFAPNEHEFLFLANIVLNF